MNVINKGILIPLFFINKLLLPQYYLIFNTPIFLFGIVPHLTNQLTGEITMTTLTTEQVQAMLGFSTTNNETKTEKKSEFWLNVGVKIAHPETGEPMYVNLPLFCPLDGLKPVNLTGTERQRQFLATKNAILEAVMQIAHNLQIGETIELSDKFVVQISRADLRSTEVKQAEAAKDNPYINQLGKLF